MPYVSTHVQALNIAWEIFLCEYATTHNGYLSHRIRGNLATTHVVKRNLCMNSST